MQVNDKAVRGGSRVPKMADYHSMASPTCISVRSDLPASHQEGQFISPHPGNRGGPRGCFHPSVAVESCCCSSKHRASLAWQLLLPALGNAHSCSAPWRPGQLTSHPDIPPTLAPRTQSLRLHRRATWHPDVADSDC